MCQNRRFLLLLTFSISFGWHASLLAQKASLIFRMDDVVLQADSMQDAVLSLFARYKIPLNWGVIPFTEEQEPRDNADSSYNQNLQLAVANGQLELLLHGFSHTRNPNSVIKSEFCGLPLPTQIDLLRKGRDYIQEKFKLSVPFFAPPWNTYDETTLLALQKVGFQGISADLGGESVSNGLAYLPCTQIDFGNWDKVLAQSHSREGVIVVLFHAYSFSDSGFTLQHLDTLLAQTVANGNACFTFSGYTQHTRVFPSSYRYTLNAKLRYSRLFFFLPDRAGQRVFLEDSYVFIATWVVLVIFLLASLYFLTRRLFW